MLENCEVISSVQKNNIKINKIMTELWYYKQYNNLIDKVYRWSLKVTQKTCIQRFTIYYLNVWVEQIKRII